MANYCIADYYQSETYMPIHFLARLLLLTLAVTSPLTQAYAELIDDSRTLVMTEEQAEAYYAETFGFRAARWKIKPEFSVPEQVKVRLKRDVQYEVTLKLSIDKQGDIVEVMLIKPSGNRHLDALAMNSVKKAKLKPFTKNGQAVTGQVVLPIRYIL